METPWKWLLISLNCSAGGGGQGREQLRAGGELAWGASGDKSSKNQYEKHEGMPTNFRSTALQLTVLQLDARESETRQGAQASASRAELLQVPSRVNFSMEKHDRIILTFTLLLPREQSSCMYPVE